MFYNYQPYSYRRRYYHLDPHSYYRRYYNPLYNVLNSQIANSNQSIINYGRMTDVIQDSDIYQSMTPTPMSAPDDIDEDETGIIRA